jgi:hypothetical protein
MSLKKLMTWRTFTILMSEATHGSIKSIEVNI